MANLCQKTAFCKTIWSNDAKLSLFLGLSLIFFSCVATPPLSEALPT